MTEGGFMSDIVGSTDWIRLGENLCVFIRDS